MKMTDKNHTAEPYLGFVSAWVVKEHPALCNALTCPPMQKRETLSHRLKIQTLSGQLTFSYSLVCPPHANASEAVFDRFVDVTKTIPKAAFVSAGSSARDPALHKNINIHLKNIYEAVELKEAATCKDFIQVQQERSRRLTRPAGNFSRSEAFDE